MDTLAMAARQVEVPVWFIMPPWATGPSWKLAKAFPLLSAGRAVSGRWHGSCRMREAVAAGAEARIAASVGIESGTGGPARLIGILP